MIKTFTLCPVSFFGILVLAGLGLWGCGPDIDGDRPRAGNLKFRHMAALGDAYTSGYSNGGLTLSSQEKAFPNLVAEQLSEIRYLTFSTPWLEENGSGYLSLSEVIPSDCAQLEPQPVLLKHSETFSWRRNISSTGPYDNLGIPGLSMEKIDWVAPLQDNAYLDRILSDTDGGRYLDLLYNHPADMYLVWFGLTDLLNYAQSGGTVNPTSGSVFASKYSELVELLSQNYEETTLILLNLPDPLNFPYFSALPHQLPNETTCNGASVPIFIETQGGAEVRIATQNDRLLLGAADSLAFYGGQAFWGREAANPVPDHWVLDMQEIQVLQEHLAAYNSLIYEKALSHSGSNTTKTVLVDLFRLFENIAQGHTEDGVNVTMEYLNGGIFSIDGLSLTPRGNAVIANASIESINSFFGSSIPTLNITDFEGVIFP